MQLIFDTEAPIEIKEKMSSFEETSEKSPNDGIESLKTALSNGNKENIECKENIIKNIEDDMNGIVNDDINEKNDESLPIDDKKQGNEKLPNDDVQDSSTHLKRNGATDTEVIKQDKDDKEKNKQDAVDSSIEVKEKNETNGINNESEIEDSNVNESEFGYSNEKEISESKDEFLKEEDISKTKSDNVENVSDTISDNHMEVDDIIEDTDSCTKDASNENLPNSLFPTAASTLIESSVNVQEAAVTEHSKVNVEDPVQTEMEIDVSNPELAIEDSENSTENKMECDETIPKNDQNIIAVNEEVILNNTLTVSKMTDLEHDVLAIKEEPDVNDSSVDKGLILESMPNVEKNLDLENQTLIDKVEDVVGKNEMLIDDKEIENTVANNKVIKEDTPKGDKETVLEKKSTSDKEEIIEINTSKDTDNVLNEKGYLDKGDIKEMETVDAESNKIEEICGGESNKITEIKIADANSNKTKEIEIVDAESNKIKEIEIVDRESNKIKEIVTVDAESNKIKETEIVDAESDQMKEIDVVDGESNKIKEIEIGDAESNKTEEIDIVDAESKKTKEIDIANAKSNKTKETEIVYAKSNKTKETEIVKTESHQIKEIDIADAESNKTKEIDIVDTESNKTKEIDIANAESNKTKQTEIVDAESNKTKETEIVIVESNKKNESVVEPPEKPQLKKTLFSKLSNTLDILSDDEDELPDTIMKENEITKPDDKQCINIEDDDDIMLIDEDVASKDCTNKPTSQKTDQFPEKKEEEKRADSTIDLENSIENVESGIPAENVAAEMEKDVPSPEKETTSNVVTKEEEKPKDTISEKVGIDKPLLPENFLKTYKKNLSDMTREDLEEFCILKIVESIVDRSNLSDIKTKLKEMTQTIEEYKKKAMMLTKQNRDLQVVVKSVQEEQKKCAENPAVIKPLKITRSVGMQVLMTEKPGMRKKSTTSLATNTANNPNNRNPRNINQSPKPQKSPATSQIIPVPRLVPAVNNPVVKISASTIQSASTVTQAKTPSPAPNGVRNSPPIQKIAEKRPISRVQSVTVDLTDDEPPSKITPRNSPAPPVRLVSPQNLLAPRPPVGQTVNSPRKVYIPISGPQGQAIRPGHAIMLKSVPGAGPGVRPAARITSPHIARMPQQSVRVQARGQNRHPAPLPDAVKQYQPPNWKALPPAPDLKLSKVENGIVISWKIEGYQEDSYEEIASYQLYAYQETSSPPSTTLWKKIGDVKALPLPMACTLTHVMAGFKYYFAVRAVDIRSRLGPFSLPGSILLLNKL